MSRGIAFSRFAPLSGGGLCEERRQGPERRLPGRRAVLQEAPAGEDGARVLHLRPLPPAQPGLRRRHRAQLRADAAEAFHALQKRAGDDKETKKAAAAAKKAAKKAAKSKIAAWYAANREKLEATKAEIRKKDAEKEAS